MLVSESALAACFAATAGLNAAPAMALSTVAPATTSMTAALAAPDAAANAKSLPPPTIAFGRSYHGSPELLRAAWNAAMPCEAGFQVLQSPTIKRQLCDEEFVVPRGKGLPWAGQSTLQGCGDKPWPTYIASVGVRVGTCGKV
jgi:hypothetical protein